MQVLQDTGWMRRPTAVRWSATGIACLLVGSLVALQVRDPGDAVADSSPATDASMAVATVPTTTAPPTPVTPTTATPPPPGSKASSAPRSSPSPTTPTTALAAATSTTVAPQNWDYHVELSRTCASAGDTMTATLVLVPHAGGGIAVYYADYSAHGTNRAGFAGPDGRFTHTWTVPSEAPEGEAKLQTLAREASGARQGTKALTFRVVAKGTPC